MDLDGLLRPHYRGTIQRNKLSRKQTPRPPNARNVYDELERGREVSDIDPRKVWANAERYWAACQVLGETTGKDQELMVMLALPQIVLSAFASELYLKCLLLIEECTSVPNDRNLKRLFDLLMPQTRAKITELWNSNSLKLEDLWKIIEENGKRSLPRTLSTLLELSSIGFQKLRYVHEDCDVEFFVSDLPRILLAVILERMPSWAQAPAVPVKVVPRRDAGRPLGVVRKYELDN
jgi:hypothetical protein